MKINKYFGVDGAKQARGVTVIIDIFRAATTSAYLLSKGVSKILPVASKEEAFEHKKNNPDWLLVGEEQGIKINGFDYGNSPHEISLLDDLNGATVVHRSSQGTQGIVNADGATEIVFGSFCTCQAVTEYITSKKCEEVSIVAMDGEGSEDDLFADYLIAELTNKKSKNIDEIVGFLKHHPKAWRFLDPNNKEFAEQDFYLCLSLDTFDFVPLLKEGHISKAK